MAHRSPVQLQTSKLLLCQLDLQGDVTDQNDASIPTCRGMLPHSEMAKKEMSHRVWSNFFTRHIEQIRSVRLRCFLPFQALVFAHIRSSLHKGTRFSIRLRLSGVSPFTNAFCEESMQDQNESL